MCGILGLYKKNKLNNQDILLFKNQLKNLSHRGPDNINSLQINDSTLFGHTRLSIIDLDERSNQPMYFNDENLLLIFNGEIYNFIFLKEKFLKDVKFKTNSDTEVLLCLFKKFGIYKTLNLIEGMYAFSIYDINNSKIYLARDQFGEKPLFYFHDNEKFIFSSTANIVSKYQKNSILDFQSLEELISKNYTTENNLIKGILELPPSSLLEFDLKTNELILKQVTKKNIPLKLSLDYDALKSKIKTRLIKSIEQKLYADVPVGIFLSGGIDSTLITVLAKKYLDINLSTYTVDFNSKTYSEGEVASKTASDFNLNNKQIKITPHNVISLYSDMSYCFDIPLGDMAIIPNYEISKLASKEVKVALSGDGGDELFFGYNRYVYGEKIISILNNKNNYLNKTIIFSLKLLSLLFKDNIFGFNEFNHKVKKIISALSANSSYEFYDSLINNFDKNIFNKKNNKKIINEYSNNFDIKILRDIDLISYLPKNILVKTDRTSMWHGLEVRAPFLDSELKMYADYLKDNFPKKRYLNKNILKDILKEEYPEYRIQNKKGLGVPMVHWFRNELKDWSHNIFKNFKHYDELNLSQSKINNILTDHFKCKNDYSNTIWTLLMLFKWYENSYIK